MTSESGNAPRVAAVVLAAGGSLRMGELKQLLPIGGEPMVRRAAQTTCSAGLEQVVVVVGADAERVMEALQGLPIETLRNEQWAEGMSTSLRAGLRALRPEIEAVLVILADQPGLTPRLLRRLVKRYMATRAPIVAPVYHGQRGNPVLWDRALFPELLQVEGDRGGRDLLGRYEEEIQEVPVDDPSLLADVDILPDYHRALETQGRR